MKRLERVKGIEPSYSASERVSAAIKSPCGAESKPRVIFMLQERLPDSSRASRGHRQQAHMQAFQHGR
jgi:hypothetical protein